MLTHTGPFCVTCDMFYVPEANMICGFCARGYGSKERTIFEFLASSR